MLQITLSSIKCLHHLW